MNKLPINSVDDAIKIGALLTRSGMFGTQTDEAGAVIALMCYQEDKALLEFQNTYHIMDSKPSMKADVMLAKFMKHGGDYEIVERSKTRAEIKIWRDPKKPRTFSLTMEEVIEAGYCFGKDGKTLRANWKRHPHSMLWARVTSDAVRAMDPRVNAGFYTPEEMDDVHGHDAEPDADFSAAPTPKAVAPKAVTAASTPDAKPTASTPVSNPAPAAKVAEPATSPKPQRAANKGPVDDPYAAAGKPEVDYTICPVGKVAGTAWIDLPREMLLKVLENPLAEKPVPGKEPKKLEQGYIDAVKDALERLPF